MNRILLAALCAITLASQAALAQSTAFTYQGRLKTGADPASGLHDFRFRLWDAGGGGLQVGSVQCVDNILVTEGVFSVTIDFGQQFTTAAQRFLEIEVRADSGLTCASAAGFVVLAPRQLLTAAPLANNAKHANAAFSLDAADGSPANAVFVDNGGKVGIGTTAPTHSIHIATAGPTIALQDTNAASQQAGYVSYRDNANVERAWVGYGSPGSPDFSILNARPGGDIVLTPLNGDNVVLVGNGGNVGVGTNAPAAKLDVRGNIRLGNVGQFFAPAGEQNLRILAGVISLDGSISQGSGFTCQRLAAGRYRITYNTPFPDRPVVTATTNDEGAGIPLTFASIDANYNPALYTNYVEINVARRSDGGYEDRRFHFIVVGLR